MPPLRQLIDTNDDCRLLTFPHSLHSIVTSIAHCMWKPIISQQFLIKYFFKYFTKLTIDISFSLFTHKYERTDSTTVFRINIVHREQDSITGRWRCRRCDFWRAKKIVHAVLPVARHTCLARATKEFIPAIGKVSITASDARNLDRTLIQISSKGNQIIHQ